MVRRTKEEAHATRERLLDAAELLFQAQGVSQTSLQQIAQAADATRGAVYWHFKDKADLFNAMMDRVTLPMETANRAATDAGEAPLAAIERSMTKALQLVATDPQVKRVFEIATHKVEYTNDLASVRQRHLNSRNECLIDFEKALREAAHECGIKLPIPATTAAKGMHALIAGLIQDWLLDPTAFDLVTAGQRVFQVYLAGLGFDRHGAPLAAASRTDGAVVV
ncbi:TetR family transcriptional regulator [Variovorax sp. J22R133]|uniref:TetR family transcriptional regulator n=1 Tax=Variovorax brevis TaxID=3053503 RepID=UPI0025751113|nr:TetR family transcriptional regulator [Variovorax sp. J22R133]MDM0115655.1 TetR family transcriptional regulator [Variovorax sp. J22R133]